MTGVYYYLTLLDYLMLTNYQSIGFFYLGNHPKTGLFKHLQFSI